MTSRDKEIARKKRRLDGQQLARVTNGLLPLWQKGPEFLINEVEFGLQFARRQRMYGVPPLTLGQDRGELSGTSRFNVLQRRHANPPSWLDTN
jgi:hypothetical protein